MPLAELESFSIPEGREYVGGLVTPRAAADTWEGLRLLHIAAEYQLPPGKNKADGRDPLIDFLIQGCQQYAAAVQTPEEERQDTDFRLGMKLMLGGLFNLDLTQLLETNGATVEEFIDGYLPQQTQDSAMFGRGKQLAWEYVRYLTAAILINPALEAVPA